MNVIAKGLIITGGALILMGLIWQVGGKYFPLGRLPGDILIQKESIKFYFPIVTCIVISLLLSLIHYVLRLFR